MEKIIIITKEKTEEFELQPMGLDLLFDSKLSAKISVESETDLLELVDARTVTHVSGTYTKDYECANIIGITKDVLTGIYTVIFDTDKFSVLKAHTEDRLADLESQNVLLTESVLDMSEVVYTEPTESEVE